MFLKILELVVLALFVLARIAGTCVIVWLCCQYVNEGRFWLILAAIVFGLGFSFKYHNPTAQSCLCEEHRQISVDMSKEPGDFAK